MLTSIPFVMKKNMDRLAMTGKRLLSDANHAAKDFGVLSIFIVKKLVITAIIPFG
ncbi:hypothetical protein [Pseudomonas syringae]|uniref:hypothetical protein n=1 Tax=Pseudomonas syringae TaxID=317 RepID=UPI001360B538|nr:hypothetical protein [Pseudomonas syringae]